MIWSRHKECPHDALTRPTVLNARERVPRSAHPRVILCGASILNAFLRGAPSQVIISHDEASQVLEQVAPACQRCLDQIEDFLRTENTKNNSNDWRRKEGVRARVPLSIR